MQKSKLIRFWTLQICCMLTLGMLSAPAAHATISPSTNVQSQHSDRIEVALGTSDSSIQNLQTPVESKRLATKDGGRVYKFELKEDIGPNSWRTVSRAFNKAEEEGVDAILIELNTFGGMVNFADSIRSRILDSSLPSIVFINHNAASAGALISLAADRIYMGKGSSIGAASVVNQSGEIMPEKYQSYMRSLMRATAEAKGRDPKLAEAFVDPEIDLPGIKPTGKILSLTAKEAVALKLADGEELNANAVLEAEGFGKAEVLRHEVTWVDQLIGFLINPMVSGILILLIIGGIYMELQTPGIGLALVVAVVAAVLFFAPLYLQGLADNWEIFLFLIGLVLVVLEIFVIPGFGVAGISGIVLMICGLAFSMVANDWFDFRVSAPGLLMQSFLLVIASMGASIALLVIFGKSILQTRAFKRLVLQDEQRSEAGYSTGSRLKTLLGKEGLTKTVMRPSGKVEIEGSWYDAVALDGYIERDEQVYVEKQENYNIFVRKSASGNKK